VFFVAELSASATDPAAAAEPRTPAPPVADQAVAAAERIAFLALASELARGRDVLVIDDGASALAGIAEHLDSCELSAIATVADAAVDLVVADLTAADSSLDRLARVVRPETGIALVRLPNRPEFAPLLAALEANFARSITLRQHNWVSSALFDDAMFENDDPSRAVAASVRKLAAAEAGDSLYNVVVACHGSFPDFRPQLALTRAPELRAALTELAAAREQLERERGGAAERIAEQDLRIRELESELAWYDENKLALRGTIEKSSLAASILALWITISSNAGRIRRALRG
jgi:hypothetical protein